MITIIKHKQHFLVQSDNLDKLIYDLYNFNKDLKTFKLPNKRSKKKMEVDKEFFVIDYKNNGIRYINTVFGELLYELNQIYKKEEIKIIEEPPVKGMDIDFSTTHGFELRDYQKEYKNAVIEKYKEGFPSAMINLVTGGGKTIIALEILSEIKKRFMVLVLPRYIDKWIGDISENTNIKSEEIYIIKGSDSLRRLLFANKEDLKDIKCFVASMTTISNYIKEWLTIDDIFSYNIPPEKIAEHLDIGIVLNDESHQEFHNVFKFVLFANIDFLLGLTATLDSNIPKVRKMHTLLFPHESRLKNLLNKRYINVISIMYNFRNSKRIRVDRGYGYNQATFEQSIMRNSDILERYLRMIVDVVNAGYIKIRKPGDKLLIFAGTIEMCKLIRDKLREEFPDLNIIKYNSGQDEYKDIEEADIIVSTINSLGTAVDIKNLVAVIQTVAIDSITSNKQSIGRLRDIGKEVYFYYIWSRDIKQHSRYNKNRLKYFKDIAKDVKVVSYKNSI